VPEDVSVNSKASGGSNNSKQTAASPQVQKPPTAMERKKSVKV